MGLAAWLFNKFNDKPWCIYAKFLYCLVMVFLFPFGFDYDGYPHAKFIAALFFGYFCYRVWGEDKPSALLYKMWYFF